MQKTICIAVLPQLSHNSKYFLAIHIVTFVKFYFRVQSHKMYQMGLPTSSLICLWLLTSEEITVTGLAALSRGKAHLPDAPVYAEDLGKCQSKRFLK